MPKRLINSPFEIAQNAHIERRDVHTQAIQRFWPGPAYLHRIQLYEQNNTIWKVIVPLQFLLKGWGDANEGYQGYIHTITQNFDKKTGFTPWHDQIDGTLDSYNYVGITGRNWLLLLTEHIGEICRGSRKSFHDTWRESMRLNNVNFCSHLWEVNLSYEEAMNWEEATVDKFSDDPNILNMIPGGFKGLRYLHKLGITEKTRLSLEERENAITEYARQNPRKGIPNPFMVQLWEDDEFYTKVIEARPKSLSRDQVRMIKKLHELGQGIPEITKKVGAINELQVKRVIEGKTYTRYK